MSEFNGDLLDEGLQNVMGKDRCQNVWEPKKSFDDYLEDAKKNPIPMVKAKDAKWEPVKEKPNQMEKVKACAKDALLFGGLSLIFFYFQQSGQMLPSAAMPCICVCCIMLGLGVGKNA